MTAPRPNKIWWTALDIAQAALPDLPASRQGVEAQAKRDGWREDMQRCRKRSGRGGGMEYSWELFPMRARRKLLNDAAPKTEVAQDADQHAFFDKLPEKVKARTRTRLDILRQIDALERTGVARAAAVEQIAALGGVSGRTVWNWLSMVEGIDPGEWLFHLAPRHRAADRSAPKADAAREFMDHLKSLFLRLGGPTFQQCYRDAKKIAEAKGWSILTTRTARRRLNADVPRVVQVFAREGEAGLARCFPPQIRDKSKMHALEGVNADCHKFDVFVVWPGQYQPSRAQIVAFQDIYSGKILSWKIDHTPNEVAVMSAFGEMVENYGIPKNCTFDNGREFASKWLSGGAKTRYRGKIRDDDPLGVLPQLGIEIHWAMPAHGQAKPVERAFRDFASDIAKDVRFHGAYVGNRPDAKPENYGERAIPIDRFLAVVDERVREHNARVGRTSPTANGRSFDETFAASYETSTIRRASDEQKRLWLMGQKTVTLQQSHGRAHLYRNYYWAEWMAEFAGKKVIVRFDIEDLHSGAYLYELTGEYLGFAPCQEKSEFYSLNEAKQTARQNAAYRRAQKNLLKAERKYTPDQLAATLDEIGAPADPELPAAKIVQMHKGEARPRAARAARPDYEVKVSPDEQAAILEFEARHRAEQDRKAAQAAKDQPLDRFEKAITLERRIAVDDELGQAELDWLSRYTQSAEYRSMMRQYEDFGDTMFLK